jgi:hypothetical protein
MSVVFQMMLIVTTAHKDQKFLDPYIDGYEFAHALIRNHVRLASVDVITYSENQTELRISNKI